MLKDSSIKVCTVIGFPLEQQHRLLKRLKHECNFNGVDEVRLVINIGALKSGQNELVESDIKAMWTSGDKLVKVIIRLACLVTMKKFKPVNLPNLQEQTS